MKAMILAAGMGTRLKEYTQNKPKALVEVNGRPLIAHVISKLVEHGFTTIVVNVHHFANQLIEYLQDNSFGVEILISDESQQLLNTGGGIINAQQFLSGNKPFLVHNVDIISDINLSMLYNHHVAKNPLVTLAVARRESTRQFLFDKDMKLVGWKNLKTNDQIIVKPDSAAEEFAFSGIHVISPSIFKLIKQRGAFSIVDTYLDLCRNHPILGYDTTGNYLLDVGKVESLAQASRFLGKG
ncbi:MAG TPA: hypothetical protein DG754_11935 [Bacteroidales bacterium]|nr:hypothetical protein [Bacteroidales bacterium]